MSGKGYIRLHRRLLSSWIWDLPPAQFKVVIALWLRADWRGDERGRVRDSTRQLERLAKISRDTIVRTCKLLRDAGKLRQETDERGRSIVIVGYDKNNGCWTGPRQPEKSRTNQQTTEKRTSSPVRSTGSPTRPDHLTSAARPLDRADAGVDQPGQVTGPEVVNCAYHPPIKQFSKNVKKRSRCEKEEEPSSAKPAGGIPSPKTRSETNPPFSEIPPAGAPMAPAPEPAKPEPYWLPGARPTARVRQRLDRHRDDVTALWRLQEQLRADVRRAHGMRTTSGLRLTVDRALAIVKLLEAGNTRDDLALAQKNRAAECLHDKAQLRWFNGASNWRPDNVTRSLGGAQANDMPQKTDLGLLALMQAEHARQQKGRK